MVMNDEWLVFEQCEFNTTWKEIGLTMMNDEWFVLFFFCVELTPEPLEGNRHDIDEWFV